MRKKIIIDADEPEWQRRAFEAVDLGQEPVMQNFCPQEHEEFIYAIGNFGRSKNSKRR